MKRSWAAFACAVILAVGGAALYADASTAITIGPSDMKDGETKTVIEDGKTITIKRDGNSMLVTIEGADKTDRLSITREGGRIRIDRGDGAVRTFVVPDVQNMPQLRTLRQMGTYYVCPKDHATLSVPDGKEGETYKCPVDGTTMEKKKGRGFRFYFDEGSSFESHIL